MRSKAIFFLYRFLQALLSPFIFLYFVLRVLNDRDWAGTIISRLGFLSPEYRQTVTGAIWFHAVSVGEVIAMTPLVERVRQLLPGVPLFVSVTTVAGWGAARQKLAGAATGIFYAPADFAFAVRRVLRSLRPTLLVIAETEIWPNLLREAARIGCGVMIVNGRISDRAFGKYSLFRPLFRGVLQHVDRILAQNEEMRGRFVRAGAAADRVVAAGNLKYDYDPVPAPAHSPVRAFFAGTKVWIAASTSDDGKIAEEDVVLSAFGYLRGWKLLIAPRKPERFDEVARKLDQTGLAYVRRSEMTAQSRGDVLLLDTIGELAGLFDLADAVFMGGTLANRGGHNILEPAMFGKRILIGPHMENFREIAEDFRAAGAVAEAGSAEELAAAIVAPNDGMGARARACALAKRGAVERAAGEIRDLYSKSWSCYMHSLPARILLWPLAQIWKAGGQRRLRNHLWGQKRLPVRVISIGNITVGGTGKTPHVLHVARHLQNAGLNPGILTRGYGRRSPHKVLALAPGEAITVDHTGDEAQIMLRARVAAVGVGGDRAAAGKLLCEKLNTGVLILDDGFQHMRLARDVDIVLIDALNPFGECEVVPLGRLREPMKALSRASIFIITRAAQSQALPAIEARLRQYNPWAPIFRSSVAPREWVEVGSNARYPPDRLPFERTMAFCGIGNPQSFWRTLANLRIKPFESLEYDDHHSYTPREIRRFGQLAQSLRAEALLTTEKDAMNLCEQCEAVVAPVHLLYLRIGVEIENEAEFFRLLT